MLLISQGMDEDEIKENGERKKERTYYTQLFQFFYI